MTGPVTDTAADAAGSGVTAGDVARVGRTATVAQWGVAVVVMAGSAAAAGTGFGYLGEHWAIGVITGLGVDLALASGLVIGRRLRAVGVTTTWGTVLLWLTGAMTLCLNSGAAALTGQWVLAVAHAFLPVLLVVLCEAGSEAQLKLHQLAHQTATAQQAHRDAHRDAELRHRAELEHATTAQGATAPAGLTATTTAPPQPARLPQQRDTTATPRRDTTATPRRRTAAGTTSREHRREWVRQQRAVGGHPSGADVDHRFGPPRTGAAVVAEVDVELRRAAVHAVDGGRA